MDESSRKRLKAVIKKIGLVEALVWNERSGTLVGGHQRINILDSLHKTDDYYLDVSCVDMDKKAEVEANIALNNDSIFGEFDVDCLSELTTEFDLDFKSLGFTDGDIDLMFDGELAQMLEDTKEVQEAKNTIGKIKEERGKAKEKFREDMSAEFYFVVVCESGEEKEKILQALKVPMFETYIGSHKILNVLKC